MLLLLQLHFLRILHIRIRSFVSVHISVEIKEYPFIPIFTSVTFIFVFVVHVELILG